MSNLGLELALRDLGLEFVRAGVGDRYVKALMEARGWRLGGESSGHIICADHVTTGDGIVAALQVLVALRESGRSLAELRSGMRKCPQTMINVPVDGRFQLDELPGVAAAVKAAEQALSSRGRVLLRPSGTEPLVRVMVEGEDAEEVERLCQGLAIDVAAALRPTL
jgi:phosphoglucosamine mutase